MISRNWIWIWGLLLLAYFLRVFHLDAQSIWWDEGISLHLATSALAEIVRDRLNNIHPPLYFFILKSWLALTGVNAFSARYLSVLAGWLQVGLLIAVVRRWYAEKTVVVAGLLIAISAVSVIYSQEIRVYAFLPLIYLALLAFTREATSRGLALNGGEIRFWIFFGMVMWIGLHLHYITIFVLFYINLWAIWVFGNEKRWAALKRWLLLQFVVLFASLPWFIDVSLNWTRVAGEANAGTYTTEPVPLQHLLNQLWSFHLSGLPGLFTRPAAAALFAVLAGLFLAVLILRLSQRVTRRETVFLSANWLVPLGSALVVWAVRSFSHPRYVAMLVPGLIMLAAYMILPPLKSWSEHSALWVKVVTGLLLIGLVAASTIGLVLYFFDPDVAKDDMRGVAQYLESNAASSDLILVPDTDWSLTFEYEGDTPLEMPHLDDQDGGWSHLAHVSEGSQRVFVVDYANGTRDWQRRLPFALVKSGSIVNRETFDGLYVNVYELHETISAPQMSPTLVNFDPLVLTGVWIDQNATTNASVAVALDWRLSMPVEESLQISLRLQDEEGWSMASEDGLLRDRHGRPTDQWRTGETVTTYHIIRLPAGIPPVDFNLKLQAYFEHGKEIQLLEVLDELGAPQGREALIGSTEITYEPSQSEDLAFDIPLSLWPEPQNIAPGLVLLAAELENASVTAGDLVHIRLLWQAREDPVEDLRPQVVLAQGSSDLDMAADAPVYGSYPTNLWHSGQLVFERRRLRIPANAMGKLQVLLRFEGKELSLGELEVDKGEHRFDPVPVKYNMDATFGQLARLIGFDIDKVEYHNEESIPLTLVWHAQDDGSAVDYVVFTHLLDKNGHLIGQHDAPPDNGRRMTTGWVSDEYVIDLHEITLREPYQGEAAIEVGLYEPITGERLLMLDGTDHLVLPVTITIAP